MFCVPSYVFIRGTPVLTTDGRAAIIADDAPAKVLRKMRCINNIKYNIVHFLVLTATCICLCMVYMSTYNFYVCIYIFIYIYIYIYLYI